MWECPSWTATPCQTAPLIRARRGTAIRLPPTGTGPIATRRSVLTAWLPKTPGGLLRPLGDLGLHGLFVADDDERHLVGREVFVRNAANFVRRHRGHPLDVGGQIIGAELVQVDEREPPDYAGARGVLHDEYTGEIVLDPAQLRCCRRFLPEPVDFEKD